MFDSRYTVLNVSSRVSGNLGQSPCTLALIVHLFSLKRVIDTVSCQFLRRLIFSVFHLWGENLVPLVSVTVEPVNESWSSGIIGFLYVENCSMGTRLSS